MIPRAVYHIPSQIVVLERGPTQGNPGISEAFTSPLFDTFNVHPQGVLAPQTGVIVSTGDESTSGVGLTRRPALYYLDAFLEHTNATSLPLTVQILGDVAQSMQVAVPPLMELRSFIVQTAEGPTPLAGRAIPFYTRILIPVRYFQIRWTYPAVAAARFHASFVLRAV